MKLEFWLDYLSPLCYKQHKKIETLMHNYIFKDLELLYRSYEMIPLFEPLDDCSFYKIMSHHHVVTESEAEKMFPNLPCDLKPVKVNDAHRLSHLAKKENLAFAFNQAVFKAFYEEKQDISNHDVLIKIALEVGMDEAKVRDVLSSTQFDHAVQSNRENAIVKGIFELPHLRIDGKIRLNGVHDERQLLQQLNRASAQYMRSDYCEGENCIRKKTI